MTQREAAVIECFLCGGWHESAGSGLGFAAILPCPKASTNMPTVMGASMPPPRKLTVTVNVDGERSAESPPQKGGDR